MKILNDKFYTKPDVAKKLISFVNINSFEQIIEPAAGNGSFSKQLKCNAYDIEPEDFSIKQMDFLDEPTLEFVSDNILIIGNPPFGRNGSLALKFFKRSSEFAKTIAFVLPLSFRKISIQNRLPLNFHLNFEYILTEEESTFITDKNKNYYVPTVFQVWEKKKFCREKIVAEDCKYFTFVDRYSVDADFSIRRVGFNAGNISHECKNKTEVSHYFIAVNRKYINKSTVEKIITNIKWDFNNSIGPRSISKLELIHSFLQQVEHGK